MVSEREFLLHAFLMGAFLTFVYDWLRIFRRVVKHNTFFVSAEDLGFWIYCGGKVFLLLYRENNGTLRWFAVTGAFAGIVLYRKTLSPFFVKYVAGILQKVIRALSKAVGWLFSPLRAVCRKTGRGARKLRRGLHILIRRLFRRVKNRLTYFLKNLKISLKR